MTPHTTEHYSWGHMTWILNDKTRVRLGFSVAKMMVLPQKHCGGHSHDNADEFITVDTGSITIKFSEETVSLTKGQHFILSCGVKHEMINMSNEPAELTIIYSHPHRSFLPHNWSSIR